MKNDLTPLRPATKDKIRVLFDKGWTSAKIRKKYPTYTVHQIAAVKG